MAYFNEIIVGENFALNQSCLARAIHRKRTPISEENLRKSKAIVLQYRALTGHTAYLLKTGNIIVAMIGTSGNGFDFLRLVCEYDARIAYDIRNFFC